MAGATTVVIAACVGWMGAALSPASASGVGVIVEFPGAGHPYEMAADRLGNLWYTDHDGNAVRRMSTAGTITANEFLAAGSSPEQIAAGPDGNMWFAAYGGSRIEWTNGQAGVNYMPTPTSSSGPVGIAAGPDGNVWFTEMDANKIGRITPSGYINEFAVPNAGSGLDGIVAGPDGNLWFTEGLSNRIGRITPGTDPLSTLVNFFVPTASSAPSSIAVGPDRNLWFTEFNANKIARLTIGGGITEFDVPTAGSAPYGIAAGPDGNLWFTESAGNKIGRITPEGAVTEYPVPSAGSGAYGIAAGGDGNMWFAEPMTGKVGRISTGVAPGPPTLAGSGRAGEPLTCIPNLWDSSQPSITWRRNGAVLVGKTSLVFVPTTADAGTSITCGSTSNLQRSPATRVVPQQVAAVWAPGVRTVRAGKLLLAPYATTRGATLTARLAGKRGGPAPLQLTALAKTGTNTLRWQLPAAKRLPVGTYTLSLLSAGSLLCASQVRILR